MRRIGLIEEELTRSVIGAFYEVHKNLGFGFLENMYTMALERELISRGHQVGREVSMRVVYKGEVLAIHRLDMLVDAKLVVEVKSSAKLSESATRQLYSYLHGTNLRVGLVLHFGPTPNFRRVIHDLPALPRLES
jgi:GxxExxY protein